MNPHSPSVQSKAVAALMGLVGLSVLLGSCASDPDAAPVAAETASALPFDALAAQSGIVFVSSNAEQPGIFVSDLNSVDLFTVSDPATQDARWGSWSPTNSQLLFESQGDIYLFDANTNSTRKLIEQPAMDARPVWSPDGQRFAFERDNGSSLWIADTQGGEERLLPERAKVAYRLGNWNPAGTEIIYIQLDIPLGAEGIPVSPGSSLMLIQVDTGEIHPLFADPPEQILNSLDVSFSPNGEEIAIAAIVGRQARIWLATPQGTQLRELTQQPGSFANPVWSPDGAYILAASGDGAAIIFSVQTGEIVETIPAVDGVITEWFWRE